MYELDSIKARLQSFGYTVKVDDIPALTFCMEKVRNTVKNETNQTDIPEGLVHIAIDMVCGEFLNAKKTFAPDDLDIDLEAAVKQIQSGDTNTVFEVSSSSTPEQRFDAFVGYLLGYGKSEFNAYRKIRW